MERGVRSIFHAMVMLTMSAITAQAQPVLIKEIPRNSTQFFEADNVVYFFDASWDSESFLYKTDGTAQGTSQLHEVHLYNDDFTMLSGIFLFLSNASFSREQVLWRSDGTPSGTFPLRTSDSRDMDIVAVAGDYLYFKASDLGAGAELFRTDGTVQGTMMVKDINPGPASGIGTQFTPFGDELFFSADDGAHGMELWKTDGTSAGTVMVKDINPGPSDGIGQGRPVVFGSNLFFSGMEPATGEEVWISDGSEAGTKLLYDLTPGAASAGFIGFMTDDNTSLYFYSTHVRWASGSTLDLWKTNGSSAGTMKLSTLSRCSSCEYVDDYRFYNGRLFFFVPENSSPELWSTDGTIEGTEEIFNLEYGDITYFNEVNGQLLFLITSFEAALFYRTDGSSAGTEIFRSFNSFDENSSRYEVGVATLGNRVFFADHDGPANSGYAVNADDDNQLFQSDGFETQSLRAMGAGSFPGSGNPISFKGKVMFTTFPKGESQHPGVKNLWVYDPSKPIAPKGSLTLVNADTDKDVERLDEGDLIIKAAGTNFNVRYNPVNSPGSVVFKHQGKRVRLENEAPFSLAGDVGGNYGIWSGGVAGSHTIEAIPYAEAGGNGAAGTPVIVNFIVQDALPSANCQLTGTLLREYWGNVSGPHISDIPVHTTPSGTSEVRLFEGPENVGTNYGSRISGYVCPPMTGEYTFWIASNDHSELWISDSDDPLKRQKIAYVNGATNPRQWDKFSSQMSAPVLLTAGTKYYIEALHKQNAGTDHVAVAWRLPSGVFEGPIGGNRLSTSANEPALGVTITSPSEGQEFQSPADIEITGTVASRYSVEIQIFAGSKVVGSPYYFDDGTFKFTWENVETGTYPLKAVIKQWEGETATSQIVNITVNGPCSAAGTITREEWSGVQGNMVSDIPLDRDPSERAELTIFETGALKSNYGARFSGFICPPETGNYIFWISSNDHSELWISTDDDATNRQRIAYVDRATNYRQWNKFPSQQSAPVTLTQGKRYYIEALHKQGVGTDHLSVGWQLPSGTLERPIQGTRLSPVDQEENDQPEVIFPANGETDIDPLVARLKIKTVIAATRYTIELNTDENFSGESLVINSVEDFQSDYIVKNLQSGTTYFTRVRSGQSDYGPVSSFTTRDMIANLRLYGLTGYGGSDDVGTLFSYSIGDGTFTKHYDHKLFYWDDSDPESSLDERLEGTLVAAPDGMAFAISDHSYNSRLFTFAPDGSVVDIWEGVSFARGKMFLASNHKLYVANRDELGSGDISVYDPMTGRQILRHSFFENSNNGGDPAAPLIELPDGYLYGTAAEGGVNDGGVVFRVRPDGSGFEVIRYFATVADGRAPYSGLTEHNGYLYGATMYGGSAGNKGTVYRVRPDGTSFSKLHEFNGINGAFPESELVVHQGVLYGTTNQGGAYDMGTVFKLNIDGTGFERLHDFDGANGSSPSRGLVHDRDGNFYGMTRHGGAGEMGVIYKIDNGGSYTNLFDFTGSTGGHPDGILLVREDTYGNAQSTATMSVQQESFMEISVHPNPTTDGFNVMVSGREDEPGQIVVSDQYGQTVASYEIVSGNEAHIGSELRQGVYIMKLIMNKHVTTKRIVKK